MVLRHMCLQLPTSDIVNIKKLTQIICILRTRMKIENTYRVIVTKVYQSSIRWENIYTNIMLLEYEQIRDHKDKELSLAVAQLRLHYDSNQDINTNNSQQKLQHQK